MPFVPAPRDLTRVKTKIVFNLTKRQLICFGAAAVVGIPAYLLTKGVLGNSAAVILMIGIMLPLFFLAMYERDGLPAERVARYIIRAKLWRGARPYRTENLYKYLSEEGNAYAIQNKTTAKTPCKHPAGKVKPR